MIKICGITRVEDALHAARAGATAIGFNFYPASPRCVSRAQAAAIVSALKPRPVIFGVFVRGHLEAMDLDFLDAVQLHGYIDERTLPACRKRRYAAVGPEQYSAFPNVPVILDESWGRGVPSRTAGVDGNFILAGGLQPDTVAEAIENLRPMGVDVCSGVESSPGIKDHEKVTAFIEAARKAYTGLAMEVLR